MRGPGPRSRELSRRIAAVEAPGVNTLPSTPGAVSLFWEEAEGSRVRDVDGTSYIDLTSGFGVAAVGHRHPRVVEAVREQAGRLLHGLGDVHGHPLRVELAERLVRLAPVASANTPQVFFSISGSEAVEIAIKTALAHTRRPGVLAFEPSYHGLTMGALAVTSRPEFRKPFEDHLHGHVHRLPFACDPGQVESTLQAGKIGAVVVEPIVGREGILVPPSGWLSEVAKSCQRNGTLLIADEVFTGFGRTGRWFAVEHEGVRPDILCCGKALGGGMPIAAVLARRELFRVWETRKEALHTATFVANPVACAAALATLSVIEEEDLPGRAATIGEWVGRRLASFGPSRGRGLVWGVEMETAEAARAWTGRALERGVLLLAGGPEGKVAQIVPPLTIPEELLETALDILRETVG
ncbi:MAG: aspartate aminotransferase family protein [Acidobacteriota bacterium]